MNEIRPTNNSPTRIDRLGGPSPLDRVVTLPPEPQISSISAPPDDTAAAVDSDVVRVQKEAIDAGSLDAMDHKQLARALASLARKGHLNSSIKLSADGEFWKTLLRDTSPSSAATSAAGHGVPSSSVAPDAPQAASGQAAPEQEQPASARPDLAAEPDKARHTFSKFFRALAHYSENQGDQASGGQSLVAGEQKAAGDQALGIPPSHPAPVQSEQITAPIESAQSPNGGSQDSTVKVQGTASTAAAPQSDVAENVPVTVGDVTPATAGATEAEEATQDTRSAVTAEKSASVRTKDDAAIAAPKSADEVAPAATGAQSPDARVTQPEPKVESQSAQARVEQTEPRAAEAEQAPSREVRSQSTPTAPAVVSQTDEPSGVALAKESDALAKASAETSKPVQTESPQAVPSSHDETPAAAPKAEAPVAAAPVLEEDEPTRKSEAPVQEKTKPVETAVREFKGAKESQSTASNAVQSDQATGTAQPSEGGKPKAVLPSPFKGEPIRLSRPDLLPDFSKMIESISSRYPVAQTPEMIERQTRRGAEDNGPVRLSRMDLGSGSSQASPSEEVSAFGHPSIERQVNLSKPDSGYAVEPSDDFSSPGKPSQPSTLEPSEVLTRATDPKEGSDAKTQTARKEAFVNQAITSRDGENQRGIEVRETLKFPEPAQAEMVAPGPKEVPSDRPDTASVSRLEREVQTPAADSPDVSSTRAAQDARAADKVVEPEPSAVEREGQPKGARTPESAPQPRVVQDDSSSAVQRAAEIEVRETLKFPESARAEVVAPGPQEVPSDRPDTASVSRLEREVQTPAADSPDVSSTRAAQDARAADKVIEPESPSVKQEGPPNVVPPSELELPPADSSAAERLAVSVKTPADAEEPARPQERVVAQPATQAPGVSKHVPPVEVPEARSESNSQQPTTVEKRESLTFPEPARAEEVAPGPKEVPTDRPDTASVSRLERGVQQPAADSPDVSSTRAAQDARAADKVVVPEPVIADQNEPSRVVKTVDQPDAEPVKVSLPPVSLPPSDMSAVIAQKADGEIAESPQAGYSPNTSERAEIQEFEGSRTPESAKAPASARANASADVSESDKPQAGSVPVNVQPDEHVPQIPQNVSGEKAQENVMSDQESGPSTAQVAPRPPVAVAGDSIEGVVPPPEEISILPIFEEGGAATAVDETAEKTAVRAAEPGEPEAMTKASVNVDSEVSSEAAVAEDEVKTEGSARRNVEAAENRQTETRMTEEPERAVPADELERIEHRPMPPEAEETKTIDRSETESAPRTQEDPSAERTSRTTGEDKGVVSADDAEPRTASVITASSEESSQVNRTQASDAASNAGQVSGQTSVADESVQSDALKTTSLSISESMTLARAVAERLFGQALMTTMVNDDSALTTSGGNPLNEMMKNLQAFMTNSSITEWLEAGTPLNTQTAGSLAGGISFGLKSLQDAFSMAQSLFNQSFIESSQNLFQGLFSDIQNELAVSGSANQNSTRGSTGEGAGPTLTSLLNGTLSSTGSGPLPGGWPVGDGGVNAGGQAAGGSSTAGNGAATQSGTSSTSNSRISDSLSALQSFNVQTVMASLTSMFTQQMLDLSSLSERAGLAQTNAGNQQATNSETTTVSSLSIQERFSMTSTLMEEGNLDNRSASLMSNAMARGMQSLAGFGAVISPQWLNRSALDGAREFMQTLGLPMTNTPGFSTPATASRDLSTLGLPTDDEFTTFDSKLSILMNVVDSLNEMMDPEGNRQVSKLSNFIKKFQRAIQRIQNNAAEFQQRVANTQRANQGVQQVMSRGFSFELEIRETTQVSAAVSRLQENGFSAVQVSASSERIVRLRVTVGAPQQQQQRSDPIVLDLNGNSEIDLEGIGEEDQGADFDINADGQVDRTGFVSNGDGFLVLDRNGDGRINDGRELFGNQNGAVNGMEELRKFDVNRDGQITKDDPVFSQLSAFYDVNRDGIVNDNEFRPISELGIARLSLDYKPVELLRTDNNMVSGVGSYEYENGEVREMVDADLIYENPGGNAS